MQHNRDYGVRLHDEAWGAGRPCGRCGADGPESEDRCTIKPHYYVDQQMAEWLRRRGVGLTPTPGTVRRGVDLDHAEALSDARSDGPRPA